MPQIPNEPLDKDRLHSIGLSGPSPEKFEPSLRHPAISVIVAFSDHTPLDPIVDALARQTAGAAAEYILVDASQVLDERTVCRKVYQAAADGLDIRYHRIKRGGRAKANNYGIYQSTAELVLLLADDFIPTPGLVAEHLALHARQPERNIVGIGPGIFDPKMKVRKFMRWLDDSGELMGVSFLHGNSGIPDNYFCAANTSAKKTLLFAAGLFDEDFPYDAWDDYELGIRLSRIGMKSVYLPAAIAHHLHDIPVRERRRAMRNAGESAALFERKHPGLCAWREKFREDPWRLEMAAWRALLKALVLHDRQALDRYYRLTLDRSFVAAYRRHAADPRTLQAKALLLAGQTARAEDLYEQLCAHGKGDAESWANLGKIHCLREAWDQAERCCRKALALDPALAEAFACLGSVQEARGNPAGAIASYRRSVELKPAVGETHRMLANALLASNRPGEAVVHLRQAIQFGSQHPGIYDNLGRALAETGETDEAAMALRAGLRIDPADPALRDRLKNVLSKLDDYSDWILRYDTLTEDDRVAIKRHLAALPGRPCISLLVPLGNVPAHILRAMIDSVLRQFYPDWELLLAGDDAALARARGIMGRFPDPRIRLLAAVHGEPTPAAMNRALEQARGDYCAWLDADGVLTEHALYAVACELNRNPRTELLYSDEDRLDERGRRGDPDFKPDWNPDLLLSNNYLARLCAYSTARLRALGGWRPETGDGAEWDLALRAAEQLPPGDIRHIPHVLYHARTAMPEADAIPILRAHLARCDIPAEAVLNTHGRPQIRYPIPTPPPRVSLIIPTRNGYDILSRCIESISSRTTWPNYEIIVVNNQSDDPRTLEYLKQLERRPDFKVLPYDALFNYSAINNFAVRHASGDVIGLLNNDIAVITPDWLEEMVGHALRPEIGAVGAMLYYPDDTIQHAGVILDFSSGAGHAVHRFNRFPRGHRGPRDRALQVQNLSAVTAACLVMRRDVYEQVDGLDEALRVAFNDVDLCLRLRARGYRILWTPHAECYHHEHYSRGVDDTAGKRKQTAQEFNFLKERWGSDSASTADFSYNPNLALTKGDFALAFPPRASNPWSAWQTPVRKENAEAKSERNAACPCGSGKRYKHCHGRLGMRLQ